MDYIKNNFNSKYKIIIPKKFDEEYIEMIEWVNKNSKNSVLVKTYISCKTENGWIEENTVGLPTVFLAFENEDDAILFKIKYKIKETI